MIRAEYINRAICAECGSILMSKKTDAPLKAIQPIDGNKVYEDGYWIEVVPCKRCDQKNIKRKYSTCGGCDLPTSECEHVDGNPRIKQ